MIPLSPFEEKILKLTTWENLLADTIKLCNCTECGLEMLGDSMGEYQASLSWETRRIYPPLVAGRVSGRPYCQVCYVSLTRLGGSAGVETTQEVRGRYLESRHKRHRRGDKPEIPLG